MTSKERNTWKALREVDEKFLGSDKSENYKELVANLMKAYETLGYQMSLKLHFLDSHLNSSLKIWETSVKSIANNFTRYISTRERRYQAKWDSNVMSDYEWGLIRDE